MKTKNKYIFIVKCNPEDVKYEYVETMPMSIDGIDYDELHNFMTEYDTFYMAFLRGIYELENSEISEDNYIYYDSDFKFLIIEESTHCKLNKDDSVIYKYFNENLTSEDLNRWFISVDGNDLDSIVETIKTAITPIIMSEYVLKRAYIDRIKLINYLVDKSESVGNSIYTELDDISDAEKGLYARLADAMNLFGIIDY